MKFKFIDLFAGIGGFRIGLEKIGGECVFSSEINTHACKIYEDNYGDNPYNDVTKINSIDIPDFDVLCAGFPCQAFSISGKQKGFYDETRGTLFFDICRILEEKKPKAFILENVFNLEKHDKGRTLLVMISSLEKLGYSVSYKVLNAKDFGVPQNRQRIIIIGNNVGKFFDFNKLATNTVKDMQDFLDHDDSDFEVLDKKDYTLINKKYIKRQKSGLMFVGYRNKKIRTKGVRKGTEHLSRVHKQPNRIYSSEGIHPTIASQEQSGRYWIYDKGIVRKLTVDECLKFMGFPDTFKITGSKSNVYARIGNSVCVGMIESVGNEVYHQILNEGDNKKIMDNDIKFLEDVYASAIKLESLDDANVNNVELMKCLEVIYKHEETSKGVYTVCFTSLVHKALYPDQDTRFHQKNMPNGYSGRSYDTKYITPFLKRKGFAGAMKESGWLTRSLEQNLPYDYNYPGKIKGKEVKTAFLTIQNSINVDNVNPYVLLLFLIKGSLIEKSKKMIPLINPIEKESNISIDRIMSYLQLHFYEKYKSRGASILPVIALYSVYQCTVNELKRYEGKELLPLESHTSSDRSSGATGDIVIKDENGDFYEVVEVKFELPVNSIMIDDAYKKFSDKTMQRYYILSTCPQKKEEIERCKKSIEEISNNHGCQVIVNGVFYTLKYYLRLLKNTDEFISLYVKNLQENKELNSEHKIAWNKIFKS